MEVNKDYQSVMAYLKELEGTYKRLGEYCLNKGFGMEEELLKYSIKRQTVSMIIFELEMLTGKED